MATVTLKESVYFHDLGTMVLHTLNSIIAEFEENADEIFTGDAVADLMVEKGAALHAKFQARINELEQGEAAEFATGIIGEESNDE